MFPGSQRLVELADKVQVLQVEALCWCGSRATQNARTVNGEMVVEGEQVLVGDTNSESVVSYEVLCRRHYMRRMTAASSKAAHISPTPLPFADAEARRGVAAGS
jgi:thymidine kinase